MFDEILYNEISDFIDFSEDVHGLYIFNMLTSEDEWKDVMFSQFMSALEDNYEISVELVKVACGIKQLTLYLVILSLKEVNVIPPLYTHSTYCRAQKL